MTPAATWYPLATALASSAFALQVAAAQPSSARDWMREQAVPRFALVVGNGDYKSPIEQLIPTTYVDADIVAALLQKSGFDVIELRDQTADQLYKNILDLKRRARAARTSTVTPVALLYFSGHGFARNGQEFLVGVDAGKGQDAAVNSTAIQGAIDEIGNDALFIALIDACRTDLPELKRMLGGNVDPVFASSSSLPHKGPPGPDGGQANEFLVAYANGYDRPVVAKTENIKDHSPYSEGLRLNIARGEPLQDELGYVRTYVQRQRADYSPGFEAYMAGRVFLTFDEKTRVEMQEAWQHISTSPTWELVEHYELKYYNGPWAASAKQWLAENVAPK